MLDLLLAPLTLALVVAGAILDLVDPPPTGPALGSTGPWAHVDEIPL